ncbi:hypothetical protein B7494_g4761 [Chlorociboria aeruginascens]|nr:hypothetical protein B7494_g4761 [Chlorociboria aeruginascens]
MNDCLSYTKQYTIDLSRSEDAITSSSPRVIYDLDGRPQRLPLNPSSNEFTIPLPRRTTKQHSIQSIDEVVCSQILDLRSCWIWNPFRGRGLADEEEQIDARDG